MSEVEAALAQPFNLPVYQKDGPGGKKFDYVAWYQSVRHANQVFGPMAWSTTIKQLTQNPKGYEAIVSIRVLTIDDTTGTVVETTRDGAGYSDITQTRAGEELRDMASKAAATDALSKAFKLFGDNFGLGLYDKDLPAAASTSATTPRQGQAPRQASDTTVYNPAQDDGGRPTRNQISALVAAGLDERTAGSLTFRKASTMIGALKNWENPVDLATAAGRVGLVIDNPDGIPF